MQRKGPSLQGVTVDPDGSPKAAEGCVAVAPQDMREALGRLQWGTVLRIG
ncbi:hypothetical protein [Sphingobium lignivorans]|uniref:L,D-peptidoglycan transpeptidase YkuD (ErfK/YbiS/YcfS/YnhG family) n=1 Tax=Sphingobium lignivorans TaxID=2735886 RepID=A0ABR6NAB3_9SPHN|nr:hypothetical protein [Sphingobium lignivorans]MBB5984194.1 L,D-peptidoglycan transpeptidase YkuD (ErfK/YbiS/YcfS/YnhG family) [Sphingobium lignivorans]